MLPMRTADILSANEMDERARMLLGMLGLETQLHKRPNQLSGGQRQRVALARALANKPEIIVADEPTGNLDVASTEQVFGILRDIADNGQTVVVVTHDAALAARADRRIHIVDGKIAETTFGGDSRHAANGHDSESAGHSDSVPVLERPKRPRSDPPVSSETHLSSCSEGRQVNSTATNLGSSKGAKVV
jgi:energy-coupling factor transporter ATP-binding protein EcfA2